MCHSFSSLVDSLHTLLAVPQSCKFAPPQSSNDGGRRRYLIGILFINFNYHRIRLSLRYLLVDACTQTSGLIFTPPMRISVKNTQHQQVYYTFS